MEIQIAQWRRRGSSLLSIFEAGRYWPAATDTLNSLSELAPPVLLALGARIFAGLEQHAVQTVTKNVPGPRQTLYAAGCRMLNAYPYVPLSGSVRIGVAIFSYSRPADFRSHGGLRDCLGHRCPGRRHRSGSSGFAEKKLRRMMQHGHSSRPSFGNEPRSA